MALLLNAIALVLAKLLEAPVLNFLERTFPKTNEKKKRIVAHLKRKNVNL